jgi:hypothetical protein
MPSVTSWLRGFKFSPMGRSVLPAFERLRPIYDHIQ